jgi:hypothetical protein
MQEAPAAGEQRFGMDGLAVLRVAVERRGRHARAPGALVAHHDPLKGPSLRKRQAVSPVANDTEVLTNAKDK